MKLLIFLLISMQSSAQLMIYPSDTIKFARVWKASDFRIVRNDCMEDGAYIQQAVDSARKLKGLTKLYFDDYWYSPMYDTVISKTEWFYCFVEPIDLTDNKLWFDFPKHILSWSFYLGCPPCDKKLYKYF